MRRGETFTVAPYLGFREPRYGAGFIVDRYLAQWSARGVDATRHDGIDDVVEWVRGRTSSGMVALHDYRRLDFSALARRADPLVVNPMGYPKARISMAAHVTQGKGNLSIRWHPHQWGPDDSVDVAEEWRVPPSDRLSILSRPENELCLIRGFEGLDYRVRNGSVEERARAVTVLGCAVTIYDELASVLEANFDVQKAVELRPLTARASEVGLACEDADGEVVVAVDLVDVIAERREALRAFIVAFEQAHGTTPGAVWAACRDDVSCVLAARALRKSGVAWANAGALRPIRDKIKAAISARVWSPD